MSQMIPLLSVDEKLLTLIQGLIDVFQPNAVVVMPPPQEVRAEEEKKVLTVEPNPSVRSHLGNFG